VYGGLIEPWVHVRRAGRLEEIQSAIEAQERHRRKERERERER